MENYYLKVMNPYHKWIGRKVMCRKDDKFVLRDREGYISNIEKIDGGYDIWIKFSAGGTRVGYFAPDLNNLHKYFDIIND